MRSIHVNFEGLPGCYVTFVFVWLVAGFPCPVFGSCEVKTRYLITLFILKITCVRNQKQELVKAEVSAQRRKRERFIPPIRSSQLKRHWTRDCLFHLISSFNKFWSFPAEKHITSTSLTLWAGKTGYLYLTHFSLSLRLNSWLQFFNNINQRIILLIEYPMKDPQILHT